MRHGDLVVRKSYGGDVVFSIQEITARKALLKGVDFRLMADSPMNDLQAINPMLHMRKEQEMLVQMNESVRSLLEFRKNQQEKQTAFFSAKDRSRYSYFEVPGKVLHLDGDPNYLRKSMTLYGELRIPAEGFYVNEANMAGAIARLLPQVKPDIVVLTGHDGILKERKGNDNLSLSSYKNSHNFVNAVHMARQYEAHRDGLVVIAGACQSHFEALLQAGANFASSPARVLIHALDPLYVAAKVSFTSIKDTVHILDVIRHTFSGLEGMGGVETKGCHRIGLPSPMKLEEKNKFT